MAKAYAMSCITHNSYAIANRMLSLRFPVRKDFIGKLHLKYNERHMY